MHPQILKALACLLAISPPLDAAPADKPIAPGLFDHSPAKDLPSFPRRHDNADDVSVFDSIQEEDGAWTGLIEHKAPSKRSESSDVGVDALTKRLEAVDLSEISQGGQAVKRDGLAMTQMEGWGETYVLRIPEEPGWTSATIRGFAKAGFDNLLARGIAVSVVSALWISGDACYLASTPGSDGVRDGQVIFARLAPRVAPWLWREIKNREVTVDGHFPKYHAEDMACYEAERWIPRNKDREQIYTPGSRVFSYGYRRSQRTPGPVAACGPHSSGISPSCEETMHDLGVGV